MSTIMTPPEMQEGHREVQDDPYDMADQYYGKRLGLYQLATSGRNIIIYDDTKHANNIIHQVDVGTRLQETKTIGFLMPTTGKRPNHAAFDFATHTEDPSVRGPTLFAMSGWSHSQKAHPQVVDSSKWAFIALQVVAPCIGHAFKRHWNDNAAKAPSPEYKGRAKASHIEITLSTAYVFGLAEAFVKRTGGQSEVSYIYEQLRSLFKISDNVPNERQDVSVYSNHDPCGGCRDYVSKLEQFTGLRIRLVGSSVTGPRRMKKTEPDFSMDWANRRIEEMLSKSQLRMAGWPLGDKERKRETKRLKNVERKQNLMASRRKDFDWDSDATLRDDSESDSDVTMRDDSDLEIDASIQRQTKLPYRNPHPEPVYQNPFTRTPWRGSFTLGFDGPREDYHVAH